MGAAREKHQADFDLERFIDMFDEALTSEDERVINALRSLMMMVVLTKPEAKHEGHDMNRGPLRQLFEDLHNLNRRMHSMEDIVRQLEYQSRREFEEQRKRDDVWLSKSYSGKDYWPQSESITMTQEDYDAKMKHVFQKINSPGKLK